MILNPAKDSRAGAPLDEFVDARHRAAFTVLAGQNLPRSVQALRLVLLLGLL
jgi:hypothetical protein